MLDLDLTHLAAIALAFALGAFVKGATGMGMPLIALPVMAAMLGLSHAISVLLIPILATNVLQLWRHRTRYSRQEMPFLLPLLASACIGMGIGTLALKSLDERPLLLMLAMILFAYVAFRIARPGFSLSPATARKMSGFIGIAAGISQGATGVSAPFAVTFIHAARLGYGAHLFALSAFFLMTASSQTIALMVSGILQWGWIVEGMLALLPVALFMPLGERVGSRVDPVTFDRLVLGLLALAGMALVLDL